MVVHQVPCELKKSDPPAGCHVRLKKVLVDGVCPKCHPKKKAQLFMPFGQTVPTIDEVKDDDTIVARWDAMVAKFTPEEQKLYGLDIPEEERLPGFGFQGAFRPVSESEGTLTSHDIAYSTTQPTASIGQPDSLIPNPLPPDISSAHQQNSPISNQIPPILGSADQLDSPTPDPLPSTIGTEDQQDCIMLDHPPPIFNPRGQQSRFKPTLRSPFVGSASRPRRVLSNLDHTTQKIENPTRNSSLKTGAQSGSDPVVVLRPGKYQTIVPWSALQQTEVLRPNAPALALPESQLNSGKRQLEDEPNNNMPYPVIPSSSFLTQNQGPSVQDEMQGFTTQADLEGEFQDWWKTMDQDDSAGGNTWWQQRLKEPE